MPITATHQHRTQAKPTIRELGVTEYEECCERMKRYTDFRVEDSKDEIWLTTHPPVYTLGQSGKAGYLLVDNGIKLVRSDRGGQITYHGPGQAIAYVLFDLVRAKTGIRTLVRTLEQATISLLSHHGIQGRQRSRMPGVYVDDAKIAALGLRVRRGRSYHGISLNVDVDLAPFADMDTCGYRDLADTSMREQGSTSSYDEVARQWGASIADELAVRC